MEADDDEADDDAYLKLHVIALLPRAHQTRGHRGVKTRTFDTALVIRHERLVPAQQTEDTCVNEAVQFERLQLLPIPVAMGGAEIC